MCCGVLDFHGISEVYNYFENLRDKTIFELFGAISSISSKFG